MDADQVYQLVQSRYAAIANQDLSNTAFYATQVSSAIGYTDDELARVPQSANIGLGCGAPVAAANLKPVCQLRSLLFYPTP